ncbi:MAG: histidine phosphatase family protein [Emcibacter sp.]|nr:histidine phosphatase family protein [Emcibacter sp.]
MAEIYLVRHGQASFGADNYDQLSDLGHQQSEYLGQYFTDRDINFDHIIIGTQHRHRQTAESILGHPLSDSAADYDSHSGLNEYDFSVLYKAFMAQHPDTEAAAKEGNRRIFYQRLKLALKLWSEDRLTEDLPESWTDFKTRVADALTHIQNRVTGTCLVVSSGGPISMAIGHILELNPPKIIDLNLQVKNTSFSHIYLGQDRMHLSCFNNIPHLDRMDRPDVITYS